MIPAVFVGAFQDNLRIFLFDFIFFFWILYFPKVTSADYGKLDFS